MNPLARNFSGARGSPNTNLGIRNTSQMDGRQTPYAVPTGPRYFQNGGSRYYSNNGNGNGNRQYTNGDNNGNNNRQNTNGNRQYQNNNSNGQGNNNRNGNVNQNSNYQGRNFNPNYRGKNFNPNFHGHQGGAVAVTRNGNSNYKGKNFNPNYCRDVPSPQIGAALGNRGELVHNHQGESAPINQGGFGHGHRGGTVADARNGNHNNQFSGPMQGPRNNCRNRNWNSRYLPLPAKFNNALRDVDILMTDAPSDEPNDIEMPDAPPIPVDLRIEDFTAGAQALQQTVSYPVMHNPIIAPTHSTTHGTASNTHSDSRQALAMIHMASQIASVSDFN